MLKLGIFPDSLKISKVVPLYRKNDDSNLSNIDLFHCCLNHISHIIIARSNVKSGQIYASRQEN